MPFESHHPSDARENAKVRREARCRRGGAPADAAAIAFDGAIGTRPASTAFDGASRRWRMRSRGCPPPRHRGDAATSQVLERYKAKVRAHLAQQKEPDTKPPKPPKRVHKVLTSAERKKLRRAYPSSHAPKWHPLCEPKHPRGVLYNRIPKSGSASIMSWMSGQLNETVLRCVEINQCVGCTKPFLGNETAP